MEKTTDTDLKSSIIEFMRERPFLWNSKHPNYKDHKRRDNEFQAFSNEIGCSVQEIKRVWHVLRTNFFRAHKLLLERPQSSNNSGNSENGEKLWKYYLAMEYILEGTGASDDSSSKETKQTRSSKVFKDLRGLKREPNSSGSNSNGSNINNNNNNDNTTNTNNNDNNTSNNSTSGNKTSRNSGRNNDNNNISNCNSMLGIQNRSSTFTSFNDSISIDDDDHLYARSLTLTLRKFDPTTKEVIKLKFQEIIVDYMRQQQQQSQQQQAQQPNPPHVNCD